MIYHDDSRRLPGPTFVLILMAMGVLFVFTTPARSADGKELAFPDVVERVKGGVAFVNVATQVDTQWAYGTAFIVHQAEGRCILATTRHTFFTEDSLRGTALIPDTSNIVVRFSATGSMHRARMLALSRADDIALLEVTILPDGRDSVLTCSGPLDASCVREGQEVAYLGWDLEQSSRDTLGNTVARWLTTRRGVVSCVFPQGFSPIDDVTNGFQVDLIVNKGASGAPVFGAETGQVVGMIVGGKGREVDEYVVSFGLANCLAASSILRLLDSTLQSDR